MYGIGKEYIFFLYENNTFLNPSTVIAISEETVSPASELMHAEVKVYIKTKNLQG